MISDLIDIMVKEGLEVPSRVDTYEGIADAVANGKIRAIIRNGVTIGFFTWREIYKNSKLYIYIENMCIKRQHRYPLNLLSLKRFFRGYYQGRYEFVYWHSQKRDRFYYAK